VIRVAQRAPAGFLFRSLVLFIVWSSVAFGSLLAASPEPVAVVSSASYDRWHDNVALIGAISGSPDLAQGLQSMLKLATANRGLAGLDTKRPWAGVVIPEQSETAGAIVDGYICLPVDDLTALLEALRPLVKDVSHYQGYGGGTHKVDVRDNLSFMVIPKGRWGVASPVGHGSAIKYAVDDPMPLLGDLPARYDLAARVYVPRLLEIKKLGLVAATGTLGADLGELNDATLGAVLDHQARRLSAELILTAKAGTPTAQRWRGYAKTKPCSLTGFHLSGAAVEGTWSGTTTERGALGLVFLVDLAKAKALAELTDSDRDDRTPDPVRQVVADVFDVIRSQCVARRMEGAVSAVLAAGEVRFVSAMRLSSAGLARKDIERLASLAKYGTQANVPVQSDVDRQGEVRLRTISIPISDRAKHGESLGRLFGERLDVAVGVGREYFYVAFGRDAIGATREALAGPRAGSPAMTAPVDLSVAAGPVADLAAALADGQDKTLATMIAGVLKRKPGRDHARLTAGPVDEGIRVRVEVDEGVLGIASLAAAMLANNQSQPAG
jgi:hypothetical protein